MGVVLQLKLLGIILFVLLEIAANIANVNHLVRFTSGINSNESLRQLWSKPEATIFKQIRVPILLSWIIALGVSSLVRGTMISVLQIVDALRIDGELSLVGQFIVTFASAAAGGFVGSALYVLDGGSALLYQAFGTCALFVALAVPRIFSSTTTVVILSWAFAIVTVVMITSWWTSRLVSSKTSTHAVRELRPSSKVPPPQQSKFAIIVSGCVLLLIILRVTEMFIVLYIEKNHYEDIYLAQVLRNFAGLMVLIGCSFTAIRISNCQIGRSMMWQWPATLIPMTTVGVCDAFILGLVAYPTAHDDTSQATLAITLNKIVSFVSGFFMYAAAGFLGAAIYLGVLARAALTALDPGVNGQSELILDDDDSEYEIDP